MSAEFLFNSNEKFGGKFDWAVTVTAKSCNKVPPDPKETHVAPLQLKEPEEVIENSNPLLEPVEGEKVNESSARKNDFKSRISTMKELE